MPFYNYYCEPCEEVFNDLVSGENYQDPQECPSCGKLSERTARGQKIVAHGIGLTEGRGDDDKARTDHRWMEDEIENTKKAIEGKSGVSPYTNFQINHDVAVEQGLAKKVSPKKSKERDNTSKERMKTIAKGLSETDKKRSEDGHNIKDN
jgi:putative FmdB family regulatory protein